MGGELSGICKVSQAMYGVSAECRCTVLFLEDEDSDLTTYELVIFRRQSKVIRGRFGDSVSTVSVLKLLKC